MPMRYSGKRKQTNRKRLLPEKKRIMPPLLLMAALLLAGCAPEEKTLLLPQASTSEDESEAEGSVQEFTVRKIYTYAYETSGELSKSAFLRGCDENEFHIISLDAQDDDGELEYLQVDYRYGFYDTAGSFFQAREISGEETEGDLSISRLLPSPDGRQLLVYVQSAVRNTLTVWLYTLGSQEPLLLYEGTRIMDSPMKGSFSPSGHWVTFDAAGSSTGPARLVPIYDCTKERSQAQEPWRIPEPSCQLHPPDQVLYMDTKAPGTLWDAALYDSADKAGLINITRESGSLIQASMISTPDTNLIPDASLLEENLLSLCAYSAFYLHGYMEMPYLQYSFSEDTIDYMGSPSRLWRMDLSTLEVDTMPQDFPDLVWDFLRLESGDLLVALVQTTGNNSAGSGSTDMLAWAGCLSAAILGPQGIAQAAALSSPGPLSGLDPQGLMLAQNNAAVMEEAYPNQNYWEGRSLPVSVQAHWGIRSADLYLYPEGQAEGHLLYKNLQNLIGMEYDAQSGRILLETYEGKDLTRRRCIILEL